ncbi:MAG: hypothetical protein WC215_04430 [Bacilli bacterium]|jgi:hypothetical protein
MRLLIDGKKKYSQVNRLFGVALLIYSVISLVMFAAILTLYFTSKDEYALVMIITIVLTIILVWGSLYFFTNPFRALHYQRNFYKDMKAGLLEESILTIKGQSLDIAIKRGVELFKVNTIEHVKGQDYERELYLLEPIEDLPFAALLKVKTFANVLISYEVLK